MKLGDSAMCGPLLTVAASHPLPDLTGFTFRRCECVAGGGGGLGLLRLVYSGVPG